MTPNQNPTFKDFLLYRWNHFYKILFGILGAIGILALSVFVFILGVKTIIKYINQFNTELILIGSGGLLLVIIWTVTEYTTYKKFMRKPHSTILLYDDYVQQQNTDVS